MKQEDALLFNFALDYIRKVQETNLELDMNVTHQVLAYAEDIHLKHHDIRTIERNAEVLLNACKIIGLIINTGETKYMEIGRHRGMVNEYFTVGCNSYEKVKTFKYLCSLLLANENSNHVEINYRIKEVIHYIIQSRYFCFLDFPLRI